MQVQADKVVVFHYTVRDSEGAFSESSEGREPMLYLHGHNNIVPGLEAEMAGKEPGAKFTATVPPELAYGVADPNARVRVPIKHLVRPGKLEPGKMVTVNTQQGPRQARIAKVGHFNVDL